ncbi:MAG: immune inhibitor A [Anaerolineales bacterium]|nr:immune inhibitor A [Anaerolineales bacterium]
MKYLKRVAFYGFLALLIAFVIIIIQIAWVKPDKSNNPPVTDQPLPIIITEIPPENSDEFLASLVQSSRPLNDPVALTQRLLQVSSIPLVTREEPFVYQIQDEEEFWVSNGDTNEKFQITAYLAHITPHLYMWVEKGSDVDQDTLATAAELFEEHTYPTTRRYFGSEWSPGVDNDVHLHILNTHRLGNNTGGFFFNSDEYSQLVNEFSNEREMFYVNLDTVQVGSDYYNGLLAHEFQHMIHFNADPNEDIWLNEGFSVLASHLNGFDSGQVDRSFLSRPDIQLNTFYYDESSGSGHYGASFLFASYLLDRLGEDGIKSLVETPEDGFPGIDAMLEKNGFEFDAESLFIDWTAALYLEQFDTRDDRYDFQNMELPAPTLSNEHDNYPVPRIETTVNQFGTDYILFAGEEPVTLIFTGTQQVKLLNTDPHGGDNYWWSNRGENMDSTLTRSFDLSGLDSVTLEYWLWYEIEKGWDYAYLEVSTDGGHNWQIIPTEHTDGDNPSGNSYGHGYTGISGGNTTPEWLHESVSLDEYAGQSIRIRFEVITDGAITYDGLALDDLSIPELGYMDGFETDDPAWTAAGFNRCSNYLAQRFAIQLVGISKEPQVWQFELDKGRGKWEIPLSNEMNQAVLIVSGITPVTRQVASYAYQVDVQ